MTPETVAERIAEIRDRSGEVIPDNGGGQLQMALSRG
jgi:hypothetical protein